MEKDKRKDKEFNPLHSIAVASGAGISILTCIGLGVWLGLKCDEHFGTYPFGLIGLSLLGAATGLWSIIRQMLEK